MRIVSLLPSATEIVAALGLGNALVGRSHECDFPIGVERLPVLTESKVHGAVGSEEIHRRVDSILREDISVYRVDAELLRDIRTLFAINMNFYVIVEPRGDVRPWWQG